MAYVHGYHERESERLNDQAGALVELLHHDTRLPGREPRARGGLRHRRADRDAGGQQPRRADHVDRRVRRVARAGARSARPASSSSRPTSSSCRSRTTASTTCSSASCSSTSSDPVTALQRLQRVLKPGGTLTVIEGDHGSTYFHPDSAAAHDAIKCLVRAPARRREHRPPLYPLLVDAGLRAGAASRRGWSTSTRTAPTSWTASSARTFTAMVEAIREPAIENGADQRRALRRGHRRPLPHRRARRHLLLHVLQGDGSSASLSLRSSSTSCSRSAPDSPASSSRSLARCSAVTPSISSQPLVGQLDQRPAAVVRVRRARDQAVALELVQPLRGPAGGDHHRRREVGQAQPERRPGAPQRGQHVVPAGLEPVRPVDRLQPHLQLAREPRHRARRCRSARRPGPAGPPATGR